MKSATVAILLFTSTAAISSEIPNTVITRLMMDESNGLKVFIQAEADAARDSGHCHANLVWDYVLSTETEFGKQLYAQLLAAHAARKQVKLVGSDTCIVNGNIEGLKRLETN